LGALIGGLNGKKRELYGQYGYALGMSFQIYDDWLGIWGDAQETGKSSSSDLVEGKKSLPVIWGLEKSTRFKYRWKKGPISDAEAGEMAEFLREDGVELRVREEFTRWHDNAIHTLNLLDGSQSVKSALAELGEQLSIRTQ
jgi:geranylgeranyl diphosphate synthase, type I